MIKTIISNGTIYGINPTKVVFVEEEDGCIVIHFDNPEVKNVIICNNLTDDCQKIIDFLNNPNEMVYVM